MNKECFNTVIEEIQRHHRIAVISHVNPDGDNIGSVLSLVHALKTLGKDAFPIQTDKIPSNMMFLEGSDLFREADAPPDLLIVVDCSDEKRLGNKEDFPKIAKVTINIDHHKSNTFFGNVNIVDPHMGSTGEILFELFEAMGIIWNSKIATPLYMAISSDTRSFMYESTTPLTLRKAAKLLEYIDDPVQITRNLYQSRSIQQVNVMKHVLNTMNCFFHGKVVVGSISREKLNMIGAKSEDTEGIVNYLNEIDHVEVAIFLKEKEENVIRISVRTKICFDASELCAKFDGGGHKRAAGCTFNGDLVSCERELIRAIKEMETKWTES